ncbi:MAG: OmpA family protein, partial [Myxococcota bacterium]
RKKSSGTDVTATGGGVQGGDQGMSARAQAIQQAQSRLQTVYFGYDSFDLGLDAQGTLRENANVIEAYPDVRIQIQGHCDERGSEEYNLSLGDKRARAIMDYLVNLGVSPSRLTTITFGEERPVDPGHNESAWRLSRRGEFVAE